MRLLKEAVLSSISQPGFRYLEPETPVHCVMFSGTSGLYLPPPQVATTPNTSRHCCLYPGAPSRLGENHVCGAEDPAIQGEGEKRAGEDKSKTQEENRRKRFGRSQVRKVFQRTPWKAGVRGDQPRRWRPASRLCVLSGSACAGVILPCPPFRGAQSLWRGLGVAPRV